MPHCACKVPERYWLAVGDEESFAVDTLAVKGYGGQELVCVEQRHEGEYVAVCNVSDICKVEEVAVVANLEFCLAFAVGGDHLGENLDVALANDACWANGTG